MKQFILQIPEKKVRFFKELIESLGFIEPKEIENPGIDIITEEHKNLVRERILSSDSSKIFDWETAQKQLKF